MFSEKYIKARDWTKSFSLQNRNWLFSDPILTELHTWNSGFQFCTPNLQRMFLTQNCTKLMDCQLQLLTTKRPSIKRKFKQIDWYRNKTFIKNSVRVIANTKAFNTAADYLNFNVFPRRCQHIFRRWVCMFCGELHNYTLWV